MHIALLRRMAPLAAICALIIACNSSGSESQSAASDGNEPATATGTTPSEGSAIETAVNNQEPIQQFRLWVGLQCERSGSDNVEFAFYVDGTEVQRLETACRATTPEVPRPVPPNGGQFSVVLSEGSHMLRLENVTHEHHAEQELHLTRDSWVTIDHRVLAGDSGFLTQFDASFEAHAFDFGD